MLMVLTSSSIYFYVASVNGVDSYSFDSACFIFLC